MVQNIVKCNNLLKYLVIALLMNLWLASSVFAENIPSNQIPLTKGAATPEESSNLQLVPIKPESYKYSFADIVEPLIPAVVNVYTVQYSQKSEDFHKKSSEYFPFDYLNELLERFNLPFNFDEMYSNPKSVPLGSGFIIDAAGFIVTNHHVVANADEIHVKLTDNREMLAKLVGSDQKTDLALLKIEAESPLPFVKFGDSGKARVGDWVIAIGNPFGRLGGTVTAGIISSKGRDIDSGIVDDFIQTDAAINNGNSGGPMFNIDGEVIGVNTVMFSPSGTNIGIGFAIPSNTTKSIINQLRQNGKINRGGLGVIIQEVTNEIAEGFGLKETSGALVVEVQKDGSGEKFGIKPGDVIIEFAGQPVKSSRRLQVMVAETAVEQEVKIVVVRDGKNHELSGKIKEEDIESEKLGDNDKASDKAYDNKTSVVKNNITFSNLTDNLKRKFTIGSKANGIIVTDIVNNGKNYKFKVGDLVIACNQQPIISVEQLNLLYENARTMKKQNIILLVQRRGVSMFIALPVTN
ncbi:Do family serine endopeptidase [Rickettsia endosymbiont of Oedothorax gibbosus]|uniref:Do family serine endopeptidase n=1 Tax=Rickettsia endosymbiont of Oedothorax gibbosus TaxID=931099 RepID=UPI0020251312|nr:Do family serine endopeptidase [Rickettsia endosymbiont of Oedothorax gibbosus]